MIFSGWLGKNILKISHPETDTGVEQHEGKSQPNNKEWCLSMAEDSMSGTDRLKNQTIEALEEAARKLRNSDISANRENVENILDGVQDQMDVYKEQIGARYHEMEEEYHKQIEPVENIICDHPIPAVMVAMGLGFLFGMLICRRD
jgi:ElaB/YqjD/DUF883 family membrane-anchored ribosome-binding protein